MYAAPTAESDFSLLSELRNRNWKEQILFIQELTDNLEGHPNPKSIEICFLGMLEEKNVNIRNKILRLILAYVSVFEITLLSLREFILSVLSSALKFPLVADIVVMVMNKSVTQFEDLEEILKGIDDSVNLSMNGELGKIVLKALGRMVTCKFNQQVLRSPLFEKCLTFLFSCSENVSNLEKSELEFLMILVETLGNTVILMMRKLKLPSVYITEVKRILENANLNGDYKHEGNEVEINYIYDLQSEEWLSDFRQVSVKCACLSLKEAATRKSISIELTPKLLESLLWLSNRKNNNMNRYIFELIGSSLNRSIIVTSNQILLEILFESIADKRISKKLKEEEITAKEELWLSLATNEYLSDKISQSSSQEQYHRLLVFMKIMKGRDLLSTKELCEKFVQKENISYVYRIQLEQLIKELTIE